MDPYQLVQQNNAWSAQQAQKQMDFQERMSNTSHQREIADLKAAGLNPVLSAKLGGASTPSGAMGDTDTSGTAELIRMAMMGMSVASSASGVAKQALDNDSPLAFDVYNDGLSALLGRPGKAIADAIGTGAAALAAAVKTRTQGSAGFESLANGNKYQKALYRSANSLSDQLNQITGGKQKDSHTMDNWPWNLLTPSWVPKWMR